MPAAYHANRSFAIETFSRDTLRMEYAWIASRDEEVEAVLRSDAFVVRPPFEPVPSAMCGTQLGDVFSRLARMNDGTRHAALRARVEELLAGWDLDEVRRTAADAASRVPLQDVAGYTIATLIGMIDPLTALPWIRDFAGAIAGGASAEDIARGIVATDELIQRMRAELDADERANLLGLLFQAHAATARLIEAMMNGTQQPPVVLTRRWAVEDTDVCGTHVRKGEAVVVLLTSPRFHFGAGRHACPGERIARAIADAALAAHITA
jgi:cytochrome P450